MRGRGGRAESQAMKYCWEWECPCIHFLYLMWAWINSCGCDDVGAQVAQDEWRLKEWPTKLPTSCNEAVLQVKAGCRTFHTHSIINCHCYFFIAVTLVFQPLFYWLHLTLQLGLKSLLSSFTLYLHYLYFKNFPNSPNFLLGNMIFICAFQKTNNILNISGKLNEDTQYF